MAIGIASGRPRRSSFYRQGDDDSIRRGDQIIVERVWWLSVIHSFLCVCVIEREREREGYGSERDRAHGIFGISRSPMVGLEGWKSDN